MINLTSRSFPLGQDDSLAINPDTLTANEARTLSYSPESHQLRNRAAKAAEEIDLRVRAKGFQLEAQPAPLNQEGWP